MAFASGQKDVYSFRVLRDGSDIGTHRVTVDRLGADAFVTVEIDLEVGFGPFVLYEYTHRNQELWRDGRLISLTSDTDDDGTAHQVAARANGTSLEVVSTNGTVAAPTSMMSTSYWDPRIVTQSQLLDSQSGALIDVTWSDLGEEEITASGRPVKARKFQASGDLTVTLWYDADGSWSKFSFPYGGSTIEYVLE